MPAKKLSSIFSKVASKKFSHKKGSSNNSISKKTISKKAISKKTISKDSSLKFSSSSNRSLRKPSIYVPGKRKLGDYYLDDSIRSKKTRNILANRFIKIRNFDKKNIYATNRHLVAYCDYFRIDFVELIIEKLKHKNRFRVLDIGAGKGLFALELSQLFKRVDSHTLSLSHSSELSNSRVKQHIGSFENFVPKNKFDLIVSIFGIHYTQNKPLAIEKVCNHLTLGGSAYLQLNKKTYNSLPLKKLKSAGFEISYQEDYWGRIFVLIKNISGKKLDLSKEILKANKKLPKKFTAKELSIRHS